MKTRIVFRYTGPKTAELRPGQFISRDVYAVIDPLYTIRQEIRID
jgi:hypothetical protein